MHCKFKPNAYRHETIMLKTIKLHVSSVNHICCYLYLNDVETTRAELALSFSFCRPDKNIVHAEWAVAM